MALLAVGFLGVKNTQAATSSFVRGAALWGSNGYLYFSCSDDVMGDRFDDPYNLCGGILGSPLICGTAPYVFHFYSPPCLNSQHQVYISNTGNFSGSAWNYLKGFVTFDATSSAPLLNYSFNVNCPNTCNAANNCLACYNENTQRVYGWARVMGDNSWINLNPATSSPLIQIKSWNASSSTVPYYNSSDLKAGDFIGYATSSGENISFNCLSAGGGSGCTSYKVYLSNLQIGHLSAPNWSVAQSCNGPALQAYLNWDLKSGCNSNNYSCLPSGTDSQIGFEVIVNTTNSTTSPAYDSGQASSSLGRFLVSKSNFPGFNYNQSYYWWVRLIDENSKWTQWYQFGGSDSGHNGLADTITDLGNTYTSPDAKTFKTYKHEFPTTNFSWLPSSVIVGATTTFTNLTQYFSGVGTTTWSTLDSGDVISATNSPSSTNIFFRYQSSANKVTLIVSDTDNYTCSLTQPISVNYGLPIWREVKAQ